MASQTVELKTKQNKNRGNRFYSRNNELFIVAVQSSLHRDCTVRYMHWNV